MSSSNPVSHRRHRGHRFLLLGLALMLFAAACSSDSDAENVEAAGPTTTSAAPTTTSAAPPSTSAPAPIEAAAEVPAAPRNDLFENAVVIDPGALPFTDSLDTTGATSDADDAIPPCGVGYPTDASVWYSITPTSDERILLSGLGTEYSWEVIVATGDRGSLEILGCRPFSRVIEFEANVTYYLNVSDSQDDGGGNGGITQFTVDALPKAPENDLPENAQVIDPDALPFTASVDTSGAGGNVEDWETGCPAPAMDASIWYTFTPTRDMRLLASGDGTNYSLGVGAYPDGGPMGIGECRPDELFFDYEANVTYFIHLFDGQEDGGGNGGNLEFTLEEVTE